MLSDRHCQLLTAYVDGELSARERRAVARLLDQSPEARAFLDKLESDSHELRRLPVRRAPTTLADVVMQTLADDRPRPVRLPRPTPTVAGARGIPLWLGLPAAACLLLAVTGGTFVFFSLLLGDRPDSPKTGEESGPVVVAPKDTTPPKKVPEAPPELDPLLGDLFAGAAERFGEKVDAKETYTSLAVGQLQQAPARERLTKVLKKETSVRLDVPVANSSGAVARLNDAFKKNGITVLVDAAARGTLNNPKKKTPGVSFVLYAENLKVDELTQILATVGKAEGAATRRGRVIDVFAVKGMTTTDRSELSKMLNVGVDALDPTKAGLWNPIIPVDPKGNPKDPKMGKQPERLALVLARGQGVKLNPKTPEIQRFMEARQALDPRMLQVVLTIYEAPA
jgi:hypothetical protein